MVAAPDSYPWSSAAVHWGTAPPDVSLESRLWEQSWTTGDWGNYLAAGTSPAEAIREAPIPDGRSAHRNLSKGWNATAAAPLLLRKAVARAKLPPTHGNQLSILGETSRLSPVFPSGFNTNGKEV
jgi:hypothetical protein